ncbi:MAG: Na+/H+ antiporter NhaC [Ectobacillus sp.]
MATTKQSILLIIILFLLIGFGIIGLRVSPHIPILLGIIILILFGVFKKIPWSTMEAGIKTGVSAGVPSIFIFLLVGVLIAVWIASGTIPTMMVYGFKLISKQFFLAAAFVVCAIVGTSIGSAFTTAATIGIAFMGMGQALGYEAAWIAGAVISGAFFGDKMSPLSDTTNLAPAVSGVDMFEHIRNMLWTTVPAFILSVLLFLSLGQPTQNAVNFHVFEKALRSHATISWVTLLPLLLLFILAIKKVPAVPTLLSGIVSGAIIAFTFHPDTSAAGFISIMQNGYVSSTGVEEIDKLLTRGGIESMLSSAALIFLALGMGGLLQKMQIIHQVMETISHFVRTTGRLIFSTAMTAMGINFLLGEQYLSILLTGQAFAGHFDRLGLKRRNLSRVLEDAGTVVNPLVPWGVSGVFLAGILNVSTIEYIPYTFFCLLCPLITIIVGFTGFGLSRQNEEPAMKA